MGIRESTCRKPRNWWVVCLLAAALLGGMPWGSVGSTVWAQPSGWPATWSDLDYDPAENGCNTHRNVTVSSYALDTGYLFLRLQNASAAGWPSTGPQGAARYKWFIDTAGGDLTQAGGGEYLLMVEDLIDNTNDPNGPRDQLGEVTLMDDLANAGFTSRWDSSNPPKYTTNTPNGSPSPSTAWRRAMGTGTPGTGGPQGASTNADVGYRVTGIYVDMFVSRSVLGNPASIQVLWATDAQNNNLDQAPNCDKGTASGGISIELMTPTPTASSTPTPLPGVVGGYGGGQVVEIAGRPVATKDAEDRSTNWPPLAATVVAGAVAVASVLLLRR